MARKRKIIYDDDLLNKIKSFGCLYYSIEKIISVLDLDDDTQNQIEKDFWDKSSLIYRKYQSGIDLSDFQIDTRVFNMALQGDLKAIEMYEISKENRRLDNKTK